MQEIRKGKKMKESVVQTIMKSMHQTVTGCTDAIEKDLEKYSDTEDHFHVESARRWLEYAYGQLNAYETCIQALTGQEDALSEYRDQLDAVKDRIDYDQDFYEVEGEV